MDIIGKTNKLSEGWKIKNGLLIKEDLYQEKWILDGNLIWQIFCQIILYYKTIELKFILIVLSDTTNLGEGRENESFSILCKKHVESIRISDLFWFSVLNEFW